MLLKKRFLTLNEKAAEKVPAAFVGIFYLL